MNGNVVACNHCHGEKKVVKNVCPICNGEGVVIGRGKVSVKLKKDLKQGDIIVINNKGKECKFHLEIIHYQIERNKKSRR